MEITVQTDSISNSPETDSDENHIWISDHNKYYDITKAFRFKSQKSAIQTLLFMAQTSIGPGKVPTQNFFSYKVLLVIDPILSELA